MIIGKLHQIFYLVFCQCSRFGHPSGTLRVGAEAIQVDGNWTVTKAIMSRSARVLMEGWVRVPADAF